MALEDTPQQPPKGHWQEQLAERVSQVRRVRPGSPDAIKGRETEPLLDIANGLGKRVQIDRQELVALRNVTEALGLPAPDATPVQTRLPLTIGTTLIEGKLGTITSLGIQGREIDAGQIAGGVIWPRHLKQLMLFDVPASFVDGMKLPPSLSQLTISGPAITSEVVATIDLSHVRTLYVSGTPLADSPDDLRALQTQYPTLKLMPEPSAAPEIVAPIAEPPVDAIGPARSPEDNKPPEEIAAPPVAIEESVAPEMPSSDAPDEATFTEEPAQVEAVEASVEPVFKTPSDDIEPAPAVEAVEPLSVAESVAEETPAPEPAVDVAPPPSPERAPEPTTEAAPSIDYAEKLDVLFAGQGISLTPTDLAAIAWYGVKMTDHPRPEFVDFLTNIEHDIDAGTPPEVIAARLEKFRAMNTERYAVMVELEAERDAFENELKKTPADSELFKELQAAKAQVDELLAELEGKE